MKQALRQKSKDIIRTLQDETLKSSVICEEIINLTSFAEADEVFVYSHIKGEPNLSKLFEEALNSGKRLCFPLCKENSIMDFYYVDDLSKDLSKGHYGIFEPNEKASPVSYTSNKKRIIICPGLGFDKDLNRLGRGKGYYDRFLSLNRGSFSKVIGVCYKELVFDNVEACDNDEKMDVIITD